MSKSDTRSFFLKLFSSRDRTPSTPKPTSCATAFQSVSILQGATACCASKNYARVRILAKHAPSLPLAKCDMQEQCHCRYVKHADRRTDARRLMDVAGMSAILFDSQERRQKAGRRKTD